MHDTYKRTPFGPSSGAALPRAPSVADLDELRTWLEEQKRAEGRAGRTERVFALDTVLRKIKRMRRARGLP